jgi:hypothetical protein
MARIWASYDDIDKAIEVLKKYNTDIGTIPNVLIEDYKANLEKAYRGLRTRFYEKLVDELPPDIVKLFV